MTTPRLSSQERWVAGTVLVVHIIAVTLLVLLVKQEEPRQPDGEAMMVRWIQRAVEFKLSTNSSIAIPENRVNSKQPTRVREEVLTPAGPEDAIAAPESRQLVLSAPETNVEFKRDLFARKVQFDTTPDRMDLQIIDRSLFAVLQRMTHAQMCKELRAALAGSSGNGLTILATMEKEGCIRS